VGESWREMAVNFSDEVYFQASLTCRKISRNGTDSFTSSPKEVVLCTLSPLKICRPRPGLNPRTLDPVESTLTTRTPRATSCTLNYHTCLRGERHILGSLVCLLACSYHRKRQSNPFLNSKRGLKLSHR
jgi:hypothetical protein